MRHYGSILFALTYLFIGWLVIMHAQHRNHELFLDSRAMLSGKTHFEQRTTCETELISRITIRIALGNVIPDENNWLFRSLSKTQFIYTGLYCLYGKHILVEDNIFCVEDSARYQCLIPSNSDNQNPSNNCDGFDTYGLHVSSYIENDTGE